MEEQGKKGKPRTQRAELIGRVRAALLFFLSFHGVCVRVYAVGREGALLHLFSLVC